MPRRLSTSWHGEPELFADEIALIGRRLADGATYREIARELDRDHKAVWTHARKRGWSSRLTIDPQAWGTRRRRILEDVHAAQGTTARE